mgnify:CR=1 FL=1
MRDCVTKCGSNVNIILLTHLVTKHSIYISRLLSSRYKRLSHELVSLEKRVMLAVQSCRTAELQNRRAAEPQSCRTAELHNCSNQCYSEETHNWAIRYCRVVKERLHLNSFSSYNRIRSLMMIGGAGSGCTPLLDYSHVMSRPSSIQTWGRQSMT